MNRSLITLSTLLALAAAALAGPSHNRGGRGQGCPPPPQGPRIGVIFEWFNGSWFFWEHGRWYACPPGYHHRGRSGHMHHGRNPDFEHPRHPENRNPYQSPRGERRGNEGPGQGRHGPPGRR